MEEGLLMENVYVYNNMNKLINDLPNDKEKWIIGGSQIYNLFIDFCDELHITRINKTSDKCDTFFNIDLSKFSIQTITNYTDINNNINYNIEIYKRK